MKIYREFDSENKDEFIEYAYKHFRRDSYEFVLFLNKHNKLGVYLDNYNDYCSPYVVDDELTFFQDEMCEIYGIEDEYEKEYF